MNKRTEVLVRLAIATHILQNMLTALQTDPPADDPDNLQPVRDAIEVALNGLDPLRVLLQDALRYLPPEPDDAADDAADDDDD